MLETTVDGIRQVTNDVAHDLRTPINRLSMIIEQIKDVTHGEARFDAPLQEAAEEIRGITATFDALLRIAQIEAGARKSHFAPTSLRDVAMSMYEAYLPVAEDSCQTLGFVAATDINPQVSGDVDLLSQLFANLIENAIRHCPRGAAIVIEIGADVKQTWISISDNGPGIPEAEIEKVQTRFYRLDKARNSPGSGLGLAMARAIVDLHDATLALRDNEPGLSVTVAFSTLSL